MAQLLLTPSLEDLRKYKQDAPRFKFPVWTGADEWAENIYCPLAPRFEQLEIQTRLAYNACNLRFYE